MRGTRPPFGGSRPLVLPAHRLPLSVAPPVVRIRRPSPSGIPPIKAASNRSSCSTYRGPCDRATMRRPWLSRPVSELELHSLSPLSRAGLSLPRREGVSADPYARNLGSGHQERRDRCHAPCRPISTLALSCRRTTRSVGRSSADYKAWPRRTLTRRPSARSPGRRVSRRCSVSRSGECARARPAATWACRLRPRAHRHYRPDLLDRYLGARRLSCSSAARSRPRWQGLVDHRDPGPPAARPFHLLPVGRDPDQVLAQSFPASSL